LSGDEENISENIKRKALGELLEQKKKSIVVPILQFYENRGRHWESSGDALSW
jgi:hypothetical protein